MNTNQSNRYGQYQAPCPQLIKRREEILAEARRQAALPNSWTQLIQLDWRDKQNAMK